MAKDIDITHNREANRFETTINGDTGYISYQRLDNDGEETLLYDHTIVPNSLGGQGVGSALVKHALDYAQAENKKIIPQCSFVVSYIKRHPEYEHLVY